MRHSLWPEYVWLVQGTHRYQIEVGGPEYRVVAAGGGGMDVFDSLPVEDRYELNYKHHDKTTPTLDEYCNG